MNVEFKLDIKVNVGVYANVEVGVEVEAGVKDGSRLGQTQPQPASSLTAEVCQVTNGTKGGIRNKTAAGENGNCPGGSHP